MRGYPPAGRKSKGTIESQVQALLSEARQRHWQIPQEWIFRDEGYSGANLERPGLGLLRDLVYEGEVDTILVYAPDRLARKYALQVLLLEEFSRHGASVEFVRSVRRDPRRATAGVPGMRIRTVSHLDRDQCR